MKIKKFYYTDTFKKKLNKLSSKNSIKIKKRMELFLENPFDPVLKTHKLTGKLKDYHSFSIDFHNRIMFRFEREDTVEFIDVGTHGIYK
jgi:addiction module RelE/StbE family toxin